MSSGYRKIEYVCDCGKNYGDCGEVGKFFTHYHGVSDYTTIYQQPHPNEALIELGVFTDDQLSALGKLLSYKYDDLQTLSKEEVELLNRKQ